MNKVIIIRGAAAAGKTTISKLLTQKLKGKNYNIDVDVIRYFDNDAKDHIDEFPIANFGAAKLASVYLRYGYNVIIDSNIFQKEALNKIKSNIPKRYPIFLFTLYSSSSSLIKRDSYRSKTLGKDLIKRINYLVNNSKINEGIFINTMKLKQNIVVNKIITYLKNNKGRVYK